MAENIVTDTQADPETRTLDARQYLDFLNQLERVGWRLPNDTRAYLVSLNPSGDRMVQPVRFECSVLNLDKELATHLKDAMVSNETLREVRDLCHQRLGERNAGAKGLIDQDRLDVARSALHEIEAIAKAIRRAVQEDSQESELLIRGLTGRIQSLSDAAHGALFNVDEEATEDLREVVEAGL